MQEDQGLQIAYVKILYLIFVGVVLFCESSVKRGYFVK